MAGDLDHQVLFALGEIKGKLDQIAEQLVVHVQRDEIAHAEQNEKIAALEKSKSWIVGAAAAATIAIQGAWALLSR